MLVPGVLGFESIVLALVCVVWLVIRHKWRDEAAKKEEIMRLVAIASQETAMAEVEATVEYTSMPVVRRFQCAVCYNPTTRRCSQCKAVRYWWVEVFVFRNWICFLGDLELSHIEAIEFWGLVVESFGKSQCFQVVVRVCDVCISCFDCQSDYLSLWFCFLIQQKKKRLCEWRLRNRNITISNARIWIFWIIR